MLKTNKNSGYNGINFNVIKTCFGPLIEPLMYIFNLSLATIIFSDDIEIARVTPVFKTGDDKLQTSLSSAMFFKNTGKNNVQQTS